MRFAAAWFCLGLAGAVWADRPITVTILHSNDLHAHIEPTMIAKKPYGGYAKLASLVKKYRANDPNAVYLVAGDVFQGTFFFNMYEGLADVAVLNEMGVNAMAVGNHEFDRGPATLVTFIRNANFPVVSANLTFADAEPLKDLVKPYTILEVGGEKIGVVGATVEALETISSPGPTVTQSPLIRTLQRQIDDLTRQGIDKIFLLNHTGYDEDIAMAKQLRNFDVIVGGHSHSPLGIPELPGFPKSAGPYPTITKDATGRNVYIVQSWEWGKVLGRMKVDFDDKGQVIRVYDAGQILVDDTVPEDPIVASMVQAFKKPIAAQMAAVVGETKVDLPRNGAMGYVLADSMLLATEKQGAVVAFINAGGVRSAIEAGPITFGQAISVAPFGNKLVLLDLTGAELLAILKTGWDDAGMLIPSRGFAYGKTGASLNGVAIDPAKTYRCCFNSFIATGGDSQFGVRDAKGMRTETEIVDIDALIAYLRVNNPVPVDSTERIKK